MMKGEPHSAGNAKHFTLQREWPQSLYQLNGLSRTFSVRFFHVCMHAAFRNALRDVSGVPAGKVLAF